MLPEELIELANHVQKHQAEASHIEVKADHEGCPKRLYDTLSSFSNQDSGGVILFGLDEASGFRAVGVYDLQNLQKQVTEQCNQMEPPVQAVFTFAQFQDVEICSAEIPGVDYAKRPCYYKGTGRIKGSYIRVGDADLPMTDYEIYSYEAYRQHIEDDVRPVPRADRALMDNDKLQDYIREKKRERPQFALMEEDVVYKMLNLTRDGVPTLAAVMNFGLYPQGYFPQLGITAIVVPGYEIGETDEETARFMDNKRIEGTISDMVDDALSFCLRNMKVKTIIDPETGKRRDKTEYPVNAVREAILNALIHRDYSIHTEGTPVQVNFFKDRLEVHSPGNLYGRMTVEQLGASRPDLRNPVLAVMAESLTGAENRYSGIPTMIREMKAHGLPAPVFENRRNEFVVTFYNHVPESYEKAAESKAAGILRERSDTCGGNGVSPECRDIDGLLEFCSQPRSRSEIGEYLGVKTNFYITSHYLNPLLARGLLAMTLPEKPKSKLQKYYSVRQGTECI